MDIESLLNTKSSVTTSRNSHTPPPSQSPVFHVPVVPQHQQRSHILGPAEESHSPPRRPFRSPGTSPRAFDNPLGQRRVSGDSPMSSTHHDSLIYDNRSFSTSSSPMLQRTNSVDTRIDNDSFPQQRRTPSTNSADAMLQRIGSIPETDPSGNLLPKSFACTTCSKAFARRSDLVRHERIHSGHRPHTCSFPGCHKQFIQRSALTVHQRVHTGEKPHVCDKCGKPFSDSSSLARHRRIHSGTRPYKCPYTNCQKTFTRKTTLTRHQRHHLGHVEDAATPGTNNVPTQPNLSGAPSANSPSIASYQNSPSQTLDSVPEIFHHGKISSSNFQMPEGIELKREQTLSHPSTAIHTPVRTLSPAQAFSLSGSHLNNPYHQHLASQRAEYNHSALSQHSSPPLSNSHAMANISVAPNSMHLSHPHHSHQQSHTHNIHASHPPHPSFSGGPTAAHYHDVQQRSFTPPARFTTSSSNQAAAAVAAAANVYFPAHPLKQSSPPATTFDNGFYNWQHGLARGQIWTTMP